MSLGERVLDWMLRRLDQAVRLEGRDLVLVRDGEVLHGVDGSATIRGETWRVARVTGELTLRDALPEADRLLAIVSPGFMPLPMDLAGRAYLGRVLEVRAEDIIAAVSNRFCEALLDEVLVRAVFESLDTIASTAGQWSLGASVSAREVKANLVAAELGAARLDRERDWEVLARWILVGVPSFRAKSLVKAALEEAQPRTGALLAWAVGEGTLQDLCTAGALWATPEGAALAPAIPGVGKEGGKDLVELVDGAMREVWRRSPDRAIEVLAAAERAARQVSLDAGRHRLLRLPLEGRLSALAQQCARGEPPEDTEVEALKRNLHAPALAVAIQVVADLARLTRFMVLPAPTDGAIVPWFDFAHRHVSWADLAFRRVRRGLELVPAWLADMARQVVAKWVKRRDTLNADFATRLAKDWGAVARSTDLRQPLALHQLSRCLVRRLVDNERSVFLLVLDGCDLASFIELIDSLPPDKRLGLVVPEVRDTTLRDDLISMGGFSVAISPVPTVTNHSRRALFAGEVPGNTALSDTESMTANASADRVAWERNSALGDIPRRLFLKGDLGPEGQALVQSLRRPVGRAEVLAAVLNGVDDALSSKETTTQPAWSFGGLGPGVIEALTTAVDAGWCVIVTADHGHTPYVGPEKKRGHGELGQRFSAEAIEGSVAFTTGPLPRQPLHTLVGFGEWFGSQRRGFHGGAGIEEVVVPLAFIGQVRGEQEGRPRAPAWWWSSDAVSLDVAVVRDFAPRSDEAVAVRREPEEASPPADADSRASPGVEGLLPEEQRILSLLEQNELLRLSQVAQMSKRVPMRAAGFMQQLIRKLSELGRPCIVAENLPDGERAYRYRADERTGEER